MKFPLTQTATALLLSSITLLTVSAGCSNRNDTIDRITDPYWKKSDFNKNWQTQPIGEDVWHMRKTITDTGVAEGRMGIADGDWLQVDRIRWEITERALIGWRDYVAVRADGDQLEGGADQCAGTRHFVSHYLPLRFAKILRCGDRSREQRAVNWEKPWYDRAFFRVEWARISTFYTLVPRNGYAVQHNDPVDPDRWRFEMNNGYFETTTRQEWPTDVYAYFGYYDPNYLGRIRFRLKHSLEL